MNDSIPFEFPDITDEEIRWVSRLMRLREDAFFGKDGTDPRREVLKCKESIDVSACPGSGKTTLLVAKLGILAEKWQYQTRGICVLSHTNVARKEIENRLGNSSAGRRLLNYPHFIGTIHGFVNEFLAVPWLRSKNNPIKMIDTEVCLNKRWKALNFNIRNALENNRYNCSILTIKTPDFDFGEIRWGKKRILGKNTPTYNNIRDVCRISVSEGYFCYDEMFIWAQELMDKFPGIVSVIRKRFPILFIDEAQDNSDVQSKILSRIFVEGVNPVIRQRFGDENQAIFNSTKAKEATTDKFPDSTIKQDIPNSYRFGQSIADLANPLGMVPHNIKGYGPKYALTNGLAEEKHSIFIFEEAKVTKVLTAYAELLLETFSEKELNEGTFTAVGQVHKDKGDDQKPRHVGHYWPAYDPVLSNRDPKPQTFIQYLLAGIAASNASNESFPIVEKAAEGVLRLAGMSNNSNINLNRRHFHRYLLQLLENDQNTKEKYTNFISKLVVLRELAIEKLINKWNIKGIEFFHTIAEKISGSPLSGPDVNDFLKSEEEAPPSLDKSKVLENKNNIFNFKKNGKEVNIRLGSIHSVKGETHTATLVLETYWNDHNLEKLLAWLKGEKTGITGKKPEQQTRLKIHYVAMTRPSHLLCLAMKSDSFKYTQVDLDALRSQGWQIKVL